MGITALFSAPWYEGTAVATSGVVPWDLEVAIGGHAYKINPTEYQRSTLPMLRQPYDTGDEPGERSLNTEGWWRRTVTDWSMGAGQTYGDDPKIPVNRSQYRASVNVDPWTKGVAKLMDATTQVYSSTSVTHMIDAGTEVYIYDSVADVVKHASKSADLATWYNANIYAGAPSAQFRNMCVAGGYVYAALGTAGVRKTAATATTITSSSFATEHADNIAFVNGFMIVSMNNVLHTLSSSGSATLLYTHWDSGFVWDTFVETPTGIVAAGNGQTQGSFFFIGLDDTTGGLKEPISAGNLPIGETIQGVTYYQGLLLIGTNIGMRLAQFSNGGVSYGPLFANHNLDWDTYIPTPKSFSAVGQYVFFNWDAIKDTYGTHNAMTGAGRVDLSQFTQPLVPAYATDISIPMNTPPNNTCSAVVAYPNYSGNGANWITRVIATSMGVYLSDPETTVDEGWIESSRFRYGVPEKKLFSSLDIRHKELTTDESVEVQISIHDEGTPDGVTTSIGTSASVGTSSPSTPLSIHSLSGETASVVTIMKAPIPNSSSWDDHTGFLFRWTMRAALTPFRQDEILVPIILFDAVDTNAEYGHDTYYDTYAEFQFLKALESSRQVVIYQEGNGSYPVVVDRVIVKPYSWNNGKTFFNGTVFVRLLTVEV